MTNRFEIEKEENQTSADIFILTDTQTGVQYLSYRNGASGSLTPLLTEDGKPLLKKTTDAQLN